MFMKRIGIESFIGNKVQSVATTARDVLWTFENGKSYKMFHDQDCCEDVYIESIDGDLMAMIGNTIVMAEEVSNSNDPPKGDPKWVDSYTWTFYKFADDKGNYVTMRWYGESNGYYSECVDIGELEQ